MLVLCDFFIIHEELINLFFKPMKCVKQKDEMSEIQYIYIYIYIELPNCDIFTLLSLSEANFT